MPTTELTTESLNLESTLARFEALTAEAAKVAATITEAASLTITTPEERENLFHLAKNGQVLVKRVEDRRVDLVKPFNDHVKSINDFAKRSLAAPIEAAILKAKGTIKAFDDEQARQQAAERERLRLEQEAREEEARKEAKRIEQDRLTALQEAEAAARKRREAEIDAMPPGPEKARALRELRGETEAKVEEINAQADQGVAFAELKIHAAHGDIQSSLTKLDSEVGRGRQTRWAFRVTDMAALYAARPDLVKAEPKTREINGEIAAGVREIPGIEIYEDTSVVLR